MLLLFQEISYSDLLEPSYERKEPQQPLDSECDLIQAPLASDTVGALSCQGEQGLGAWGAALGAPYSPHLLDGWLGAGKHRTFLTFPSYIVSRSLQECHKHVGQTKNDQYESTRYIYTHSFHNHKWGHFTCNKYTVNTNYDDY